jgi:hypothetical protein
MTATLVTSLGGSFLSAIVFAVSLLIFSPSGKPLNSSGI